MKHIIAIMAGGLGKRMNSDLPKVLHNVGNLPMICRLLQTAYKTKPFSILIIVGKYMKIIKETIEFYLDKEILEIIQYIDQPEALGTGNAIKCCLPVLSSFAKFKDRVLILSGDTPLVSLNTMNCMLKSEKCFAMVTNYHINDESSYNKFKDYGKIILNNDIVSKIIEKCDCDEMELKITCVNCGIYCYDYEVLCKCIPLIENKNKQNEYYITDIIEIANKCDYCTHKFELDFNLQYEIIGVNTIDQLNELDLIIKNSNFTNVNI